MQLALVDSAHQVASRTVDRTVAKRSDATSKLAATSVTAAPEPSRQATMGRAAPMRGGLRALDTQLNQRVAASQQTIQFLGRASGQLQSLKTALSAQLANGIEESVAADVARQIHRFGALWRERSSATGGALDSQLDQVEPGKAQQRFAVRGLTLDALRSGDVETLYLAAGGQTQRAVAVAIEPGLDDAAIAQRFDRALAPGGIRVALNQRGELIFSVPEANWTNGRDVLAIKGEGRRFPTGQFAAARIVPEDPLIRPEQWTLDSPTALRATLQKVADAHETVRHARQLATETLSDEARNLQPETTAAQAEQDAKWSADFARTFESTAGRGDYGSLSALSPALLGIHRDRVTALLASR